MSTIEMTRFLHAALLVSDLERSEYFYGTILGLKKIDRVLKFPGAWYEIGEFQIHLIVADRVASELQNPEKWGRNQHLAFSVGNLNTAKDVFVSHGYPFQMSASGRAALFVRDPDGNILELGEAT
jgi:glyoxylase I family protein